MKHRTADRTTELLNILRNGRWKAIKTGNGPFLYPLLACFFAWIDNGVVVVVVDHKVIDASLTTRFNCDCNIIRLLVPPNFHNNQI
jgi:hypothetical protein